jgi:hypothetical protein
MKIFDADEEM